MTIKLTVRQVFDSVEAMQKLISIPMPASISFRITRIATQINETVETAQGTIKDRRADFAKEGDDIPEDKMEEWDAEIGKLLDEEIEIAGEKISVVAFGTAKIEPITLLQLDWLITE